MKNLVFMVAAIFFATAQAETLKFGDVNYFLTKGQWSVGADLNHQTYRLKKSPEGPAASSRHLSEGYYLYSKFTYAFMDTLNAYLGLNYQHDVKFSNKTNSAINKYTQDGLANPVLGVDYRVVSQANSALNWDLGAVVKMNIADAEEGSGAVGASEDGNAANGRSSYELNTKIGKKWNEANEWRLLGGVIFNKSGEYTILNTRAVDTEVDQESSVDYFWGAQYQYRPVNEFMMSLGLVGTRYEGVKAEDNATGGNMSTGPRMDYTFSFVAKYLVTSNFIFKFNYSQNHDSDYGTKVQGTTVDFRNRREKAMGLGVDFLF